ncbi:MAG: M6 family metalloprotease domain-containing protein, partial [Bacteroidales bacterium]|nr:M6 family metalloprotease domain-containing protein [Bacteroidales bacterium]
MKKITLFLVNLVVLITISQAAYLENIPVTRLQPDGDTLYCFASGDEYYNYLHDAEGYTILQDPVTGYYVYAMMENGALAASPYIAGRVNPSDYHLKPYLKISVEQYNQRRAEKKIPAEYQVAESPNKYIRNRGTINNIVIFIQFADGEGFMQNTSQIDSMFNNNTGVSLYNYFHKVSYNLLRVRTAFCPEQTASTIISYQDSHNRNYYSPYNAVTNPEGYQSANEKRTREFTLLENAVNAVGSSLTTALNIDYDNDGLVDNVCFVVEGSCDAWNDLLWPHKWSLYDRVVRINGKRVYSFNFQLAAVLSVSTLCHEMFHSLGAPDLYHYNTNTGTSPVGRWDLMENNANPPQHMGAYMKNKYGNWIDDIPEITEYGTYTLQSLGDATNSNNCYKISTGEANQWYVLEYRDNTEMFETALPGKGLLIYRINTNFSGNAYYDGVDVFDEVYLFRPDGENNETNGNIYAAHLGAHVDRTAFNPTTNPFPYFSNGNRDNSINIYNITAAGNTISFTYGAILCQPVTNIYTTQINTQSASIAWTSSSSQFEMEYGVQGFALGTGNRVHSSTPNCSINSLAEGMVYDVYVRAICGAGDTSIWSAPFHLRVPCSAKNLPYLQDFEEGTMPTCWSQEHVSGNHDWIFQQGGEYYPSLAHSGSFNAAFIHQQNGSSSRLISPMMNLTNTVNPQLSFWHAQGAWQGDQDQLWVYYRTTPSENWNLLALYTESILDWTHRVIDLPNPSATYQIAFEAIDYYGFGVTLDDIEFISEVVPEEYTVQALANDANMGSVSGGGNYEYGNTAILTATAHDHYRFVSWNDGNTENPRAVLVTSDTVFTAVFVAEEYIVQVLTNNESMGSVSGGGNYEYGNTAILTATSNDHYRFVSWNDGNTGNPRAVLVTSDTVFTAMFVAEEYTVQALANDANMGSVSGGGNYEYGNTALLTATANDHYRFVSWNDGNTENPRAVLV